MPYRPLLTLCCGVGYIGLCHLRLWGHCTAGRGNWHQCKIPPQVVGVHLCHPLLWGRCTGKARMSVPPPSLGTLYREGPNVCATPFPGDAVQGRPERLCHPLLWGRCTGKARTSVPPPSLGTLYREGPNVCATPFPGDAVQGRRERLRHPLPWGRCTWRGRPASRGSSAQIAETRRSIVLALFSWCCSLLYLG